MWMNKKGFGVSYILLLIVFIIIWIVWLAPLFTTMAGVAVSNGLTGIDAFLFANLNLIILFFIMLAIGWIVNQSA